MIPEERINVLRVLSKSFFTVSTQQEEVVWWALISQNLEKIFQRPDLAHLQDEEIVAISGVASYVNIRFCTTREFSQQDLEDTELLKEVWCREAVKWVQLQVQPKLSEDSQCQSLWQKVVTEYKAFWGTKSRSDFFRQTVDEIIYESLSSP